MEVGVKWKFGNGNMYNGSVQWMTLPSHRRYLRCVCVCVSFCVRSLADYSVLYSGFVLQ